MIKKLAFWILGLGILYLLLHRVTYGYFPPETPHKIFARYLKAPIPSDWNIVYFYHDGGGVMSNPILMAIVDVPSQGMQLAKSLLRNPNPFDSRVTLQEDLCFAKSEFSRYTILSDSLSSSSSGFFDCFLEEKTTKVEGDSVSTYVAVSKTIILDVENKRLLLGMF